MVRCLKAGKVLWFPADQDHGAKSSVFAPFYGIPAATLDMPTRLIRLSGATLVFASYFRTENNEYQLHFEEVPGFTGTDSILDATELNKSLERRLNTNPEQYMWVHRRFKTRPEGEASLY